MGRAASTVALTLACAVALWVAPPARAGQVMRVDGHKVTRMDDPSVPSRADGDLGVEAVLPRAGARAAPGISASAAKAKKPTRGQKAVASALKSARAKRAISVAALKRYTRLYGLARSRRAKLKGRRGRELGSVIATLEAVALRGQLTPSRIVPMFLILRRNTQFWLRSPFPGNRGYVQFKGSQLLFEYYVGEGLQLQPLANFKKANQLHGACAKRTGVACDRTALSKLLGELVDTRVRRGKFTAWEYYFDFGGGRPPWISGMATATGIQAFGRAGKLLRTTKWRKYAEAAMPAFTTNAPTGVRTRGPLGGTHYLQYSFAPRLYVINAFLQSIIGLYDYAGITGDKTAATLWRRAEPEARAELPRNDTGDWSTYSFSGRESTREYYDLLLEFSVSLCHRLHAKAYCDTARNFRGYLIKPAELALLGPTSATKGGEARVRFSVSKLSAVQIVVTHENGKTVLDKTQTFRRGTGSFAFKPGATGTYAVSLAAKELRTGKGLRTRTSGQIVSSSP
ncbi:MAG: D-glucuronyl C5-epimerase family protein [Thermoleophilaceae bacterium]